MPSARVKRDGTNMCSTLFVLNSGRGVKVQTCSRHRVLRARTAFYSLVSKLNSSGLKFSSRNTPSLSLQVLEKPRTGHLRGDVRADRREQMSGGIAWPRTCVIREGPSNMLVPGKSVAGTHGVYKGVTGDKTTSLRANCRKR